MGATALSLGTLAKGQSAAAVRTFVKPSSDPMSRHCGIAETAAMAVRVQDADMAVNIDYHFSHTPRMTRSRTSSPRPS